MATKAVQEAHEALQEDNDASTTGALADVIGGLGEQIEVLHQKLGKTPTGKAIIALNAQRDAAVEKLYTDCMADDAELFENELVVEGDDFEITLKKPSNSTTLTKAGKVTVTKWIADNYSKEELMELIKFGITELRKYLPKNIFEKVTVTERKGKRQMKIEKV